MTIDTQGNPIFYIATAHLRNGRGAMVESQPYDNREDAAAELLAAYLTLRSCYTSRAWNGRSTGSDMRFHDRPYAQAGKHSTRIG